MISKPVLAALAASLLLTTAGPSGATADPSSFKAVGRGLPSEETVLAVARRVADRNISLIQQGYVPPIAAYETAEPKGWVQAAFLIGLARYAEVDRARRFRSFLLKRGRMNDWAIGDRHYHADDQAIGQVYIWARHRGAGPAATARLEAALSQVVAMPSTVGLRFDAPSDGLASCQTRWCWADALFMAPPTFIKLGAATGKRAYIDFAVSEYLQTLDYLYDQKEHLFFRDSRFFDRRMNGGKVFWGRGNGWVYAGLVPIIEALPQDNPKRSVFIALFKQMSNRLAGLQRPDGFWGASLLDRSSGISPEASGTGFYLFGMAWGVRHGLLPRAIFMPRIEAGWKALAGAILPDGNIGYVQRIGAGPDAVSATDTQYYGAGAFLLAASELHRLTNARPRR